MKYKISTSRFNSLFCPFLAVSLIFFFCCCSLSNTFGRGIVKIKESDFFKRLVEDLNIIKIQTSLLLFMLKKLS